MAEKIKASTILIKADTLLPAGLPLESESYSKGWELLKNVDANVLDRKIRETGWTFFFMANEINATAVGSDLEKTTPATYSGEYVSVPQQMGCRVGPSQISSHGN